MAAPITAAAQVPQPSLFDHLKVFTIQGSHPFAAETPKALAHHLIDGAYSALLWMEIAWDTSNRGSTVGEIGLISPEHHAKALSSIGSLLALSSALLTAEN